jgi:uncharacterized membrane protein YoaK (UPF0700 family)
VPIVGTKDPGMCGQARCARESTSTVPVPSIDRSPAMMILPTVLSLIAGSCDSIGFLGLGFFTAHVTGNLVILAARIVAGESASIVHIVSVPVFITALALTRVLVGALERLGIASLRPLLLLQFLLLSGFFVLCITAGRRVDPNAGQTVLAGMLGVSAMAVQNALVQISVRGAPSTAVMTTNITRFVMDLGAVLMERNCDRIAEAARRAKHTAPAIVGFAAGCGLAAWCEVGAGLWSLAMPTSLALAALVITCRLRWFAQAADAR